MSHDELTQWDHAARSALHTEVGVSAAETDLQLLLDIARDAAHAVNRPRRARDHLSARLRRRKRGEPRAGRGSTAPTRC